jgi:aspartyl-tRNA(Asn)/glutamyl-tRNA(Gln) amidotransferase subunit A
LDTKTTAVINSALEIFKRKGYEVVEISLSHTKYAIACYYLLVTSEASSNLARLDGIRFGYRAPDPTDLEDLYKRSRTYGFGPEVKRRIILGTFALSSGYFDAYYKRAQKVRTLIREDFKKAFKEVDLIITPTSPFPAFSVGEKVDDPLTMYLADIFTVGFSLAGLPTINVPCGLIGHLPVGMQITAPYLSETSALKASLDFEQSHI